LAELEAKKWNVNNLKSQINDRAAKLALDKQTTAATVSESLADGLGVSAESFAEVQIPTAVEYVVVFELTLANDGGVM
jgi:hypothetical protein